MLSMENNENNPTGNSLDPSADDAANRPSDATPQSSENQSGTSDVPASTRPGETESTSTPKHTKRRWPRRLAIAAIALVVLAGAAFGAFALYASDYYRAADSAQQSLAPSEQIPVEHGANYLAFGNPDASTGIVFYPGAKVEYSAYAPLMRNLAEKGYLAVVVEMPFNFAFFGIDAADGVRAAFPQVKSWWVGGHSLGGSMAAQYASAHANDDALDGLVLLGSYTASDLSAANLGVIGAYGSNDQVLNHEKLASSASLMPKNALMVEIPGGNHAQFGDYGAQAGDGEASISAQDQQRETADLVDEYIRTHRS